MTSVPALAQPPLEGIAVALQPLPQVVLATGLLGSKIAEEDSQRLVPIDAAGRLGSRTIASDPDFLRRAVEVLDSLLHRCRGRREPVEPQRVDRGVQQHGVAVGLAIPAEVRFDRIEDAHHALLVIRPPRRGKTLQRRRGDAIDL